MTEIQKTREHDKDMLIAGLIKDIERLLSERDEYARQRNAQCEHDADEIAKLEAENARLLEALNRYRYAFRWLQADAYDFGGEMRSRFAHDPIHCADYPNCICGETDALTCKWKPEEEETK